MAVAERRVGRPRRRRWRASTAAPHPFVHRGLGAFRTHTGEACVFVARLGWRVLTSRDRAQAPKRPRLHRRHHHASHLARFALPSLSHESRPCASLQRDAAKTPVHLSRAASGGPHSLGCPQNRPLALLLGGCCLAEPTHANSTPTSCSARRPHHRPLWLAIALVTRTKRPCDMLPKDHGIGVLDQTLKQDRERRMLLSTSRRSLDPGIQLRRKPVMHRISASIQT